MACLVFANLVFQTVYVVIPMYISAQTAKDAWVSNDGVILDAADSGFILGIFYIAMIIFSPFNAVIKQYLGSKNTLIIGMFILTMTMLKSHAK